MKLTIGGNKTAPISVPETGVKGCILNGERAGKLGACAAAGCTMQVMESITKPEHKYGPEPSAISLAAAGKVACGGGRKLLESL